MLAKLQFRVEGAFKKDKASIGIGSMIIFIAMVLVAGMAASILIQTSNELETQAMTTGQETRDEVSSGIGVYNIIGQYNNRNISGTFYERYHNMSIIVTSRAGGSGVDLGQVILKISNGSKEVVLSWDNSKYAPSSSANGVFSTSGVFDLGADDFGIIVIEDADGSCVSGAPAINRGDKAILTVNLSACFTTGLDQREDVSGLVIPEVGSPGAFLFRVPGSTSRTVVEFM